MNRSIETLKKEADLLHFETVLKALEKEEGFEESLIKARALRSVYQWSQAAIQAQKALDLAGSAEEKRRAAIELARSVFLSRSSLEAKQILKPLEGAHDLEADLALALIASEEGDVKKAVQLAESHLPFKNHPLRLRIDAWGFLGDLYTFQERSQEGADAYLKAAALCSLLEPDSFQTLRKGLIYTNLADLYEQAEDFEQADEAYLTAEKLLFSIDDSQLFDLSSYQIEVLLSMGNCFSNEEEYEKARHTLQQAGKMLKSNPPVQKENYRAKYEYLTGLTELYTGNQEEAASHFKQSYDLYKKLAAKRKEKLERVGFSAYFLAFSLPDDPELIDERLDLYQEAVQIFERLQEREPRFFLSSIASAHNDSGRLIQLKYQDIKRASQEYSKAVEGYDRVAGTFSQDTFARESAIYASINLAKTLDHPESLYENILQRIKSLIAEDETFKPQMQEILEIIRPNMSHSLKEKADHLIALSQALDLEA